MAILIQTTSARKKAVRKGRECERDKGRGKLYLLHSPLR
jgi:hypothetical protein